MILESVSRQVNESNEVPAIPQREAAKKRCPSVLLDLGMDEKTEEIRMTFCGPISGKEACRYSPERQERPGGGTEPRGRPKTVTRDQGERLGEVISCRNSAVIKRAQRTWLVSLRAAAFSRLRNRCYSCRCHKRVCQRNVAMTPTTSIPA